MDSRMIIAIGCYTSLGTGSPANLYLAQVVLLLSRFNHEQTWQNIISDIKKPNNSCDHARHHCVWAVCLHNKATLGWFSLVWSKPSNQWCPTTENSFYFLTVYCMRTSTEITLSCMLFYPTKIQLESVVGSFKTPLYLCCNTVIVVCILLQNLLYCKTIPLHYIVFLHRYKMGYYTPLLLLTKAVILQLFCLSDVHGILITEYYI